MLIQFLRLILNSFHSFNLINYSKNLKIHLIFKGQCSCQISHIIIHPFFIFINYLYLKIFGFMFIVF
jgi:hypothetical protein